jgi:hypothetical protein
MFIEMQVTVTSKINIETMEVTHEATVDAGEASVLGRAGVLAVAQGGLKSALTAIQENAEAAEEEEEDQS